ncbi:hypothetical protein K438DRAFT_1769049 [Mycena galopus ATCC 62051]|nr:hypothetical protein K438DRAFT_1769049 [Mycena galopus ATCC 62051]
MGRGCGRRGEKEALRIQGAALHGRGCAPSENGGVGGGRAWGAAGKEGDCPGRAFSGVDDRHKGVKGAKRFAFLASLFASKRLHVGGNRYSVLQSGAAAGVESSWDGDEGRGAWSRMRLQHSSVRAAVRGREKWWRCGGLRHCDRADLASVGKEGTQERGEDNTCRTRCDACGGRRQGHGRVVAPMRDYVPPVRAVEQDAEWDDQTWAMHRVKTSTSGTAVRASPHATSCSVEVGK